MALTDAQYVTLKAHILAPVLALIFALLATITED